jgi:hypothetical protein
MRSFYDQFTNLAAREGLYRVWVRANDREGSPLVARWIDPRGGENVSPGEDKKFQMREEVCLDEESSALEADPDLEPVFAGAF